MFIVIVFDSENHRDNEKVEAHGPFSTMDTANTWARGNIKFWHIVPLKQTSSIANGGLRIENTRTKAVTA